MDEDWTNGVRIIGREGKKKVEMFVKIKILKPLYELKQKVLKTCREEKVWIKKNDSGTENVKRIRVLVRTCLPCYSLEWHHDKVAEVGEINKLKIEIKKEMVYQQNYSGLGLVVYGAEQESENTDKRLMETFKNNNLD